MPECWISCFEGCLDTVEMGSLSLRGNLGDKGYKREVGDWGWWFESDVFESWWRISCLREADEDSRTGWLLGIEDEILMDIADLVGRCL